jgi:hypothetical protein
VCIEMAGSKATRVYVTSLGDVEDVDKWPAMIDWLLDQIDLRLSGELGPQRIAN